MAIGGDSGKKKCMFYIGMLLKYRNCSSEKGARGEGALINLDRLFSQLIWETILCDAVNDKGML